MVKGDTPAQNRIDKEQFERMCNYMCTKEEIAYIFNVDADTLNTWCYNTYGCTFSAIYKMFSSNGKMSLRRAMFKKAIEDENPTIQIWLSKQYLGMKDKVEYTDDGIKTVNENLVNIAELINKPLKDRTEEDV